MIFDRVVESNGNLKRWKSVWPVHEADVRGRVSNHAVAGRQSLMNVAKLLRAHGGCLGVERR